MLLQSKLLDVLKEETLRGQLPKLNSPLIEIHGFEFRGNESCNRLKSPLCSYVIEIANSHVYTYVWTWAFFVHD